jgi:hypothetical protein
MRTSARFVTAHRVATILMDCLMPRVSFIARSAEVKAL